MAVIEPTSPVEVIFSRPLSSLTHTLTLNYMATEAPDFASIGMMSVITFSRLYGLNSYLKAIQMLGGEVVE
jgi:sulfur transfer protein SufE